MSPSLCPGDLRRKGTLSETVVSVGTNDLLRSVGELESPSRGRGPRVPFGTERRTRTGVQGGEETPRGPLRLDGTMTGVSWSSSCLCRPWAQRGPRTLLYH